MEIGADCTDISRFQEIKDDVRVLEKIYTDSELQYCRSNPGYVQCLAARFAGKEAILKALYPYNVKIPFNRIEILNKANGIPIVKLLDQTCSGFQVKVSLSHAKNIAIAAAVVEKNNESF